MIYLLDTNICGYIIRNKPAYIKEKFKEVEKNHEIALSSIVVAELLYGAIKKSSPKLTNIIHSFINSFTIHDFDGIAALEYATIRAGLEKSGTVIGSNELFIVAHAKALKATLVTNNIKEFDRVPDIALDNWIE